MRITEAVKPMDFHIQFAPKGQGIYEVFIDGHKAGFFDDNDVQNFIKIKLDFLKKFEKLLER